MSSHLVLWFLREAYHKMLKLFVSLLVKHVRRIVSGWAVTRCLSNKLFGRQMFGTHWHDVLVPCLGYLGDTVWGYNGGWLWWGMNEETMQKVEQFATQKSILDGQPRLFHLVVRIVTPSRKNYDHGFSFGFLMNASSLY